MLNEQNSPILCLDLRMHIKAEM